MNTTAPGLALVTADEVRAYIARRLKSQQWWLVPWLSERAVAVSIALEGRFFGGAAASDFEVVTLPLPGVFALSVARKRRCPAQQLAAFLRKMGSPERRATLSRDLATRDVLVLGEPTETVPRVKAFATWLTTDPVTRFWRERVN